MVAVNVSSSSLSTMLGLSWSLVRGVQDGGTYLIATTKVIGIITLIFVGDG